MKARLFYIFLFICVTAVTMGYSASEITPVASNKTDAKDTCLSCHGPFDKLTTAPKTFTSESGDKINPHRYVPHDRKDAKSTPECTYCHKAHPLPLTSKEGLLKANVEWCFSCHHTYDFKACNTCH
jgi:predicted CXXCH cytochrome family protein